MVMTTYNGSASISEIQSGDTMRGPLRPTPTPIRRKPIHGLFYVARRLPLGLGQFSGTLI